MKTTHMHLSPFFLGLVLHAGGYYSHRSHNGIGRGERQNAECTQGGIETESRLNC